MSDVIDLDALAPPAVTIHFGGVDISVNAPSTATVIKLGSLGQKLQNSNELSDDEIDTTVEQLANLVTATIPELQGKSLSTAQQLKLVEILSQMAMPPDSQELKERGIEVDSPKKTT